ncbi:MAG: hypothetical protein Q4F27_02170 [Desulfovibrionaceae bacterium]|nr:hypothetical protein [Desulfovibrionaceae bacterium]
MEAMNLVKNLSDSEKVFLAAQLTHAAMAALEYEPDERVKTQQTLTRHAGERAYMVFGYMLENIAAGTVPEKLIRK